MNFWGKLFSTKVTQNDEAVLGWLMGVVLGGLGLTGLFFWIRYGTNNFTDWTTVGKVFLFIGVIILMSIAIVGVIMGLFFVIAKIIYLFERERPTQPMTFGAYDGYNFDNQSVSPSRSFHDRINTPQVNISKPYTPDQVGSPDDE